MIALLVAFACTGHRTVTGRAASQPDVDYERVHRRWTREMRLYRELETELIVRATLLSEELRRLGAQELAWRTALAAEEAEALETESVSAGASTWEVVFAVMAPRRNARSFGMSPGDPWRVRLVVGDRSCTARSIEAVQRPTPAETVLFPQVNDWAELWRARFDRDCGSAGIAAFSIAGPYASGEVRWRL